MTDMNITEQDCIAAQPVPDELVEAARLAEERLRAVASCVPGDFATKELLVAECLANALSLPRKTEAEIRADEREHLMSLALGSEADKYRAYAGYVAEWLRSPTQGET